MKTISIVTPAKNSANRLKATVDSVLGQRALASGRCNLDYRIVDGASTDETVACFGDLPAVSFLSEPDRGLYDGLTKGLRLTQGDIVGYVNAGDILFPWAFDVLLDVFAFPDVKWLTGYSTLINDRLEVTAAWSPTRYRREFVQNGYYAQPGYRKGIQQESTFWASSLHAHVDWQRFSEFRLAGDYFLWSEFSKTAELDSVMSQLGAFRIHAGQLSESRAEYLEEVASFTREATRRERFTRWWETACPGSLRGVLWKQTLGRGGGKLFEYDHQLRVWRFR